MSEVFRIWPGSKDDSSDLASLHGGAFADGWPEPAFASLLERDGVAVFLGAPRHAVNAEGFILIRAVADEAEVLTFCVQQGARRTGLGRVLLETAEQFLQASGIVKMFLEVSEDNVLAVPLYQRFGFLTVGRRAAYYKNGLEASDALVMKKMLNNVLLPPISGMDYKVP